MRASALALCLAACHVVAPVEAKAPSSEKAIEIDGDPNGLFFDTGTLYIADSDHDRILAWTDAGGVKTLASFPLTFDRKTGLGQLARGIDETLVVTRFGFGENGDIACALADGTTASVQGLDRTRRRIGIAVAHDGTLYDSWFEKTEAGPIGEVARVTLDGHEDRFLDGFKKPVGLLLVGDTLYVSDQAAGQILRTTLGAHATATPFAVAAGADLLCAGPNGDLFAGSTTGVVYRITADGHAAVFASGLQKVRGVAYDAIGKRLFIAEHGDEGAARHRIRIVPVP